MSESLIQRDVAAEISNIAALANASCEGFAHRLYNSLVEFPDPATEAAIFDFDVPEQSALIITVIDIKTLYDTADAALPGDFRSSFDLNPYGPFVAGGGVGQIRILINNEQYCAIANDIGIINAGILLVVDGGYNFKVMVNPSQPTGKDVVLVSRLNAYTVPQVAGTDLKKKQTQFLAGIP